MIDDVLRKDGLSQRLLHELSYQSSLTISIKKNLHYFDRAELLADLRDARRWLAAKISQLPLGVDYRVKSLQSIELKYERYYPDHQAGKVFNDLLGFRTLCNDYTPLLAAATAEHFKIADMSQGKASDDGYRGVHVYFQLDNHHYPLEIQYNTFYDRQLNNWLHKYIYKKKHPQEIGHRLRDNYERGLIRTEQDFKEVLEYVLSHS